MSFKQKLQAVLFYLVISSGYTTQAVESQSIIPDKNYLQNAIIVNITPEGQKLVNEQLSNVLGNMGINLSEQYFPTMSFSAQKPIKTEDLIKQNPTAGKIFVQIRDILTKWLVGFSVNDHKPTVVLEKSKYKAEIERFGLITDQDTMAKLGRSFGAVLVVELNLKKLEVHSDKVSLYDENNEVFGKINLEDLNFKLTAKKHPLRIRVPFYVNVKSDGKIKFEALNISQNIEQTDIEFSYKNLVVPKFAITINNREYFLNTAEINKYLQKNIPTYILEARKNLNTIMKNDLPKVLNKMVDEYFGDGIIKEISLPAPGKENESKDSNYNLELKLTGINLNSNLNISFASFLYDPSRIQSMSYSPESLLTNKKNNNKQNNQIQVFNSTSDALNSMGYQSSIAINKDLVNHALRLSYERGYYKNIQTKSGGSFGLMRPPHFDYLVFGNDSNDSTFFKMKLRIKTNPKSIWLKEVVVFDIDSVCQIRLNKERDGLEIVFKQFLLQTFQMDKKYITTIGKLISGKILKGFKKSLEEINEEFLKEELLLSKNKIPLDLDFLGLKMDIKRLEFDQNGYIVLYSNFENKAVSK